jgi:hypothetical protein
MVKNLSWSPKGWLRAQETMRELGFLSLGQGEGLVAHFVFVIG